MKVVVHWIGLDSLNIPSILREAGPMYTRINVKQTVLNLLVFPDVCGLDSRYTLSCEKPVPISVLLLLVYTFPDQVGVNACCGGKIGSSSNDLYLCMCRLQWTLAQKPVWFSVKDNVKELQ